VEYVLTYKDEWELSLRLDLSCWGLGGFFDFNAPGGEFWIGPFGAVLQGTRKEEA
jgi:hypothetical protein